MRKIGFFLFLFIMGLNPFLVSSIQAEDVELVVNEYECLEDGRVRIQYNLVNNRDFDIYNVIIVFKILVDNKPIACRELEVKVLKGTHGSEVHEIFIEADCKPRAFKLGYAVFHPVKRYKVDNWIADCP